MVGQNYQVQYTTTLGGTWNNLGGSFTATNGMMTTADVTGPDAQRYYRIVLLP
jgi:hypothetical protein